jgi:hypothetical protein
MIVVRQATPDDVPYLDSLQRQMRNAVGFLPTAALMEYVCKDCVSIGFLNGDPASYLLGTPAKKSSPGCAAIYQAAVQYDARHQLLGTTLVEHFVDHLPGSAVAVELWCAQDLDANQFWEAADFQALAYRVGSHAKRRIHILWRRLLNAAPHAALPPLSGLSTSGQTRRTTVTVPLKFGERWQDITFADAMSKIISLPANDANIVKNQYLQQTARGRAVAFSTRVVSIIVGGRVRTMRQARQSS